MVIRNNPPWTERILANNWSKLVALVGPKRMPVALTEHRDLDDNRALLAKLEKEASEHNSEHDRFELLQHDIQELKRIIALLGSKKGGFGYAEYGTGHYGTVMPTSTPGIVIKITSDASEAAFVAAYLSLSSNQRPVGIVPYHRIVAIRGESHLRRPVFVLWRDEAQYVGNVARWVADYPNGSAKTYYSDSYSRVKREIQNCLDNGRMVRKLLLKRPDTFALIQRAMSLREEVWDLAVPPSHMRNREKKLAWCLHAFQLSADAITSEPMGHYIGRGLGGSFDSGLLLADVHLNNIGMPSGPLAEEIGMTPIITDPGHAIALDDRYNGVIMEEL